MLTLYGPGMVGEWCGVTRAAVSNWLTRYDDWPVPFAEMVRKDGAVTYLWTAEQKPDWLAWKLLLRSVT